MSKRVAVRHIIEQKFDKPVRLSTQWLRLRPAPQARTKVTAYSLNLDAGPHFVNWVRDPYQNHLVRLDVAEARLGLTIDVEYIAQLDPVNPFDFLTEPDAVNHPFEYPGQLRKELAPFLTVKPVGGRMRRWLDALEIREAPTVERLSTLNERVQQSVRLQPGDAWRARDPEDVLESRRGTSWDLAWLLTLTLRHVGLAARFACGHRLLLVDEEDGVDSASLHCWSEVYLPGAGWVGLDPSSGLFVNESYIPFAYAPEHLRVAPVVGFREACEETQTQRVTVRRLVPETSERPGDATHGADMRAVGHQVDRDLATLGVKPSIAMGLTLVSASDSWSPEWNFAALGRGKKQLADQLALHLQRRCAPRGVVQLGQGEWMAGDPMPRWQLGLYYRTDGEPLCEGTGRLLSAPAGAVYGLDDVQSFAESMAIALGVDPRHVVPAYEDPLGELLQGAYGPGSTPGVDELADPERRSALAARLSRNHGAPAGYVLPLRRDSLHACWVSGQWSFRRDELYLAPGEFPMGYRLPLSALEHDPQAMREAQLERSPFDDDCEPLGDVRAAARARAGLGGSVPPATGKPGGPAPRTSLCVQARDGGLFVFLPPVTTLEAYLELVAAAEAAAEVTALSVCLEGYNPPEDPRLRQLRMEPDAGVLRVMLPQTDSWEERVALVEAVYEEAARVGLAAERITEDGRRLPTGGGVRMTVGGTTPPESPFLDRPALLRDFITYFQRHPSLSYFFAGKGIGPSGTGPRPDEGRDEALYELSIALGHLTEAHHAGLPWYADRVLSHLLTDPAGDAKRAEIRVDELYSPSRACLRQGRIHIGSFETAPDAETAVLQSLLVMGLIGRFAKKPGAGELVRWEGALQDRWLLPDVLWEDLRAVVSDLQEVGYPVQLDWFRPLRELRFPHLGTAQIGEAALELRVALEPQPLLAEQASGAGMARFVDVANERLQVRASGLAPDRYVLACNGHRVPLERTATHGEYLAGVRYKVANPPATLHPTLPPIEKLVFDLIDTWSGKAVGGCTYVPPSFDYSWGPYDPVSAPLEGDAYPGGPWDASLLTQWAAVRRTLPQRTMNRYGGFFPYGSGLGAMSPPEAHTQARFPALLDLVQGK